MMNTPKKNAAVLLLEKCKCGHKDYKSKEDYKNGNDESHDDEDDEMEYDVKSDNIVKKDGSSDDEVPLSQDLVKLLMDKMDDILELLDNDAGASEDERKEDKKDKDYNGE